MLLFWLSVFLYQKWHPAQHQSNHFNLSFNFFVLSFSAVYSICDMWQIKLLFGEFFSHVVYFLSKNYKRSLKGHVFELFHPGCLYSIYLAPKRSPSCFSVVSKSKAQPTCYFQTSRGTCLESRSSHRSPNPLATFNLPRVQIYPSKSHLPVLLKELTAAPDLLEPTLFEVWQLLPVKSNPKRLRVCKIINRKGDLASLRSI